MNRNLLSMGVVFFQNSGIGILFVFLPVLGKNFNDSLVDVGITVGVFYLAQFLSSAYFGRVSDRRKKRLVFIRCGFAVCAATFGMSYFIQDSSHLLLSMVGTGIAAGIMTPAILAYVYESHAEKYKSAGVISFHTLGWLAGILVTGIINSESEIFLIISAMFLAGFIISLRLKPTQVNVEEGVSILKTFRKNASVYSSTFLRHVGATSVLTVLPLFLIENLGASIFEVSMVYVVNMVVSFLVMALMASKIRMSYLASFRIGVGLSTVAFAGMLFATEWWEIAPFMFLVGVSWAFMYVGAALYLMGNGPKSTSMGIFNSSLSLGQVVGPLIAGIIAFAFDYAAVTWFMIAITVCAFGISIHARRQVKYTDSKV